MHAFRLNILFSRLDFLFSDWTEEQILLTHTIEIEMSSFEEEFSISVEEQKSAPKVVYRIW